jgi:hypothetical protein
MKGTTLAGMCAALVLAGLAAPPDVLLLVFLVGLAHAFTWVRGVALSVATAMLTATVSMVMTV